MFKRVRGALAALGILVGATACTGGGSAAPSVSPTADAGEALPSASPSASPSTSPSPSPSPTELSVEEVRAQLPEAALTEDFPGADAFASYFLDNYQGLSQQNPLLFKALSADTCDFCQSVATAHTRLREDGVTIAGGDLEIVSDQGYGGQQVDGTFGLEYDFATSDLVETAADGTVIREVAGSEGRATIIVNFDEHWKVEAVGSDQAGE
ncbi:hypothetical protein [Demequina flava]|uniref:hypothetical protein n=1 Tax=Demequina flava TaxID=1095025 RepID=UPI00157A7261|nr:hypothetical protein [Demequina flava]